MMAKIGRDAFLYLAPEKGKEKDFAQCGTCVKWDPTKFRCTILGPKVRVDATDSCGFYIPGKPHEQQVEALVTTKEAGFGSGRVRCENCRHLDKASNQCGVYATLESELPELFDFGGPQVQRKACCNAFKAGL